MGVGQLFRILALGLAVLAVTGAAAWGALALWYAVPAAEAVRATLALGFVCLGLGGIFSFQVVVNSDGRFYNEVSFSLLDA